MLWAYSIFNIQKLKEEKEQREQQLKEEKEQREQQLEAERKLFYAELDRRDKSLFQFW